MLFHTSEMELNNLSLSVFFKNLKKPNCFLKPSPQIIIFHLLIELKAYQF